MTNREREDLRSYYDDRAAEEREHAEKLAAPLGKAQAALAALAGEVDGFERERLLGDKPDPQLFVDEHSCGMNSERDPIVHDFNARVIKAFRQRNPHIYWGDELVAMISSYYDKHRLRAVGLEMLENLVSRIEQAGLLPQAPSPEPRPTPQPPPVKPKKAPAPSKPQPQIGRDQTTGLDREFSQFEVDRMSSDMYRRVFGLYGAAKPRFIDARLP